MILKTFGIYAIISSLLTNILFVYVMKGNRSAYFIMLDFAIIGIIISVCGLIFDKKKVIPLVSIFLIVIPIVIHWIVQK